MDMLMKKQNGLGLLSAMILIVALALVSVSVLRLAPAYKDNYFVGQALEKASETIKGSPADSDQVILEHYKTELYKQFRTDSVGAVSPDNLKVVREEGQVKVKLDYDVQIHLIANIDAVIHFKNEAQVKVQ
jgi:hypothetical protein